MIRGCKLLSRLGWGGLGVRRVSSLALSAFLASAAGSLPIQSVILGSMSVDPDSACESARSTWLQLAGDPVLTVMPGHKQSQWDRPLSNEVLSSLEERLQDHYDQARIKASQSSHASDWLHALPISTRASDICSRPQTGRRDREGGRWAAIGGVHMRASRVRMRGPGFIYMSTLTFLLIS